MFLFTNNTYYLCVKKNEALSFFNDELTSKNEFIKYTFSNNVVSRYNRYGGVDDAQLLNPLFFLGSVYHFDNYGMRDALGNSYQPTSFDGLYEFVPVEIKNDEKIDKYIKRLESNDILFFVRPIQIIKGLSSLEEYIELGKVTSDELVFEFKFFGKGVRVYKNGSYSMETLEKLWKDVRNRSKQVTFLQNTIIKHRKPNVPFIINFPSYNDLHTSYSLNGRYS